MVNDPLQYDRMIEKALRSVVREALEYSIGGLLGGHYFYISFRTDYPGVVLSKSMRQRYPEEITIVLQHQFHDLVVTEDWFEVTLSFNQVPERLHVPFAAMTAFADPSVKMALQFTIDAKEREEIAALAAEENEIAEESGSLPEKPGDAEIITLDRFRKK